MRKKEETSRKDTCLAHAHPEEMVFVLLGRDVAAPATIRAWVAERIRLGKNAEADEQIVEALACADTMAQEGRMWDVACAYPTGCTRTKLPGLTMCREHQPYPAT